MNFLFIYFGNFFIFEKQKKKHIQLTESMNIACEALWQMGSTRLPPFIYELAPTILSISSLAGP